MTPKEILEGNKLIAEFMNLEEIDGFTTSLSGLEVSAKGYKYEYEFVLLDDLRYHSSWDWLMSVVEKIEFLSGHLVEIGLTSCTIKNIDLTWVHTSQGISKIESVWLACLAFIKWYNQNKEK